MGRDVTVVVRARKAGGPEVLEHAILPFKGPGKGEVTVVNHSCGVNFIDVYQRTGLYPLEMPAIMGNEAAGVIERVGKGVEGFSEGDAVAYCTAGPGCCVSRRNVPADRLIPLPDRIDPALAGGLTLRGLTAEYLACRTWPIRAGMDVLVTAAAGGVGSILAQWLSRLGARVVGLAGTEEKASAALRGGCSLALAGYDDIGERVRELCPGGVAVAFDSVGAATWPGILDAIAPRGCLVSYGNASGPVPPFEMLELSRRGSLFATRPALGDYAATRRELLASAEAFFGMAESGLGLPDVTVLPFGDAARAHRMIEGRELVDGVVALDPGEG